MSTLTIPALPADLTLSRAILMVGIFLFFVFALALFFKDAVDVSFYTYFGMDTGNSGHAWLLFFIIILIAVILHFLLNNF